MQFKMLLPSVALLAASFAPSKKAEAQSQDGVRNLLNITAELGGKYTMGGLVKTKPGFVGMNFAARKPGGTPFGAEVGAKYHFLGNATNGATDFDNDRTAEKINEADITAHAEAQIGATFPSRNEDGYASIGISIGEEFAFSENGVTHTPYVGPYALFQGNKIGFSVKTYLNFGDYTMNAAKAPNGSEIQSGQKGLNLGAAISLTLNLHSSRNAPSCSANRKF
ncbi:MAG: hypothetical protein JWM96_482 [Alphaproteobacteria bacterium]|nr:hypothetical protein [Alphaproteobacteria bacterium]